MVTGEIIFKMVSISIKINSTDTVGNNIQSWLGQYMEDNNIYHREPPSTPPRKLATNLETLIHKLTVSK